MKHPDWSRSANLYQVNLRQYTPEGTFAAFQAQLPRLRGLGVDTLWLMPIQPIGAQHRKGTLGSAYAISDHLAVNPELGTLADFKQLVQAVHGAGLKLIIDWVPTAFWERARAELDRLKPVFMLAESADPALHTSAFDMTYDWALYDEMKRLAQGDGVAGDLDAWLEATARDYPPDAYRMAFTSNHDKNAWEGHDGEVFGASFQAFAVLAATLPGMPLIYGGQEAWLDKRLAFFDKDSINWNGHKLAAFYAQLLDLKRTTRALHNGSAGAPVQCLPSGNPAVFAFRRAGDSDAVTVVLNLSAREQAAVLAPLGGDVLLEPWAWRILRS